MKAFALPLAALLAGCAYLPPMGPPPAPGYPPPGYPGPGAEAVVTIPIGGRAFLDGISIEPRRVVEDSRCPANVQCVWAGRLILEAMIGAPGQPPALRQLTLGQPQPLAGGTLTLTAALPPRLAAGGPPASLFTFKWRRP